MGRFRFFLVRFLLTALIGLACAVLALALFEIYLRRTDPRVGGYGGAWHPPLYEPHPAFGHAFIPGRKFRVLHREFSPEVSIGSYGFRGGEPRLPDSVADERPALCILGDSYVAALQVSDSEVLANRLKSRLGGWRVYNLATSGWGTRSQYRALREFVGLRPRAVLLFFYENDFNDNAYPSDRFFVYRGYLFPRYCYVSGKRLDDESLRNVADMFFDGRLAWHGADVAMRGLCGEPAAPKDGVARLKAYARTHFLAYEALDPVVKSFLHGLVAAWPRRFRRGLETGVGSVVNLAAPPDPESLYLSRRGIAKTHFYLKRMRDLCAQKNCRLAVFLIPSRETVGRAQDPYRMAARRILDHLGIECRDLAPALAVGGGSRLYWRFDRHWKPEGHAAAAREVLGYLREKGVLGHGG